MGIFRLEWHYKSNQNWYQNDIPVQSPCFCHNRNTILHQPYKNETVWPSPKITSPFFLVSATLKCIFLLSCTSTCALNKNPKTYTRDSNYGLNLFICLLASIRNMFRPLAPLLGNRNPCLGVPSEARVTSLTDWPSVRSY